MRLPCRSIRSVVAVALLAPMAVVAPEPGAPAGTAERQALLKRFAPLVLLAPGERAMPANVDWFLARARFDPAPSSRRHMSQASVLGMDWDEAVRQVGRQVARLRPNAAARPGSRDPREWVVYGHAYRGRGGDVLLQYWFFYPFNDFHVVFDHEGDWEHITVRLDGALRPLGAWYARHDWSAPGKWFEWKQLEREGEHPVVLSARGSHASYADGGDVRWYDRACSTRIASEAEARGCTLWRTWTDGTGGVVDTGTRDHPTPSARFVSWPGQWGRIGWFGRETGGPPGPAYQDGWCAEGASNCS